MPGTGPEFDQNDDPFSIQAREFIFAEPELSAAPPDDQVHIMSSLAIMLQVAHQNLAKLPAESPPSIAKIGVTMPDGEERMIVVGGYKPAEEVELSIKWISDPKEIDRLNRLSE